MMWCTNWNISLENIFLNIFERFENLSFRSKIGEKMFEVYLWKSQKFHMQEYFIMSYQAYLEFSKPWRHFLRPYPARDFVFKNRDPNQINNPRSQ